MFPLASGLSCQSFEDDYCWTTMDSRQLTYIVDSKRSPNFHLGEFISSVFSLSLFLSYSIHVQKNYLLMWAVGRVRNLDSVVEPEIDFIHAGRSSI